MKKKNYLFYILVIYLLIQPVLDIIATTDLNLINITIRGLFLVFMFIYLIIKKTNTKMLLFLILTLAIIFVWNYLNNDNIYNIISSTMKLAYLPTTLLFFYNIDNIIEKKYLLYTLSLYLSIYLVSYLFGFGSSNIYDKAVGKSGYSGLFNSINEISAIIIALFPISLNYLKENKKVLLQIALIIGTLLVSLLTGTKVLMLGIIISILFIYYNDLKNKYIKLDNKKKIISIIIAILLLILLLYLLTYTRFYKNMVVQNNYFKITNIFSLEFLDTVIFNKRLSYLSANFNYYINTSIVEYIFGIGFFNPLKLVEIDVFDIIFRYGLLGFITILIPTIYVFKNIKLEKIELFTIILLILVSLTSGHVLINPNVLIYFGYIINLRNKKTSLK